MNSKAIVLTAVLWVFVYNLIHRVKLSKNDMQKVFCTARGLVTLGKFVVNHGLNRWQLTTECFYFTPSLFKNPCKFCKKMHKRKYQSWLEMYLGCYFWYFFTGYIFLTKLIDNLVVLLIFCYLEVILKEAEDVWIHNMIVSFIKTKLITWIYLILMQVVCWNNSWCYSDILGTFFEKGI